jgi:phosphoglycolate phosphatase
LVRDREKEVAMSRNTILFDFDGTIADSMSAGVEAFNGLARRYGFLEITEENAGALRANGPRAAIKALDIPMLKVPLVLRTLRNGVRLALPNLPVMDGIRSAILLLKEKGFRLGIVTSNSEENVRAFLENNRLAVFDFIQAGTGIFNKATKIKKLLAKEKLKKDEIVFVGDEIRDIEAARKNDLTAVAVTWGLNSREGLEAAEPDFIVDTATELVELLLA